MRLLHTSDWHLGQSFYGKSRLDEHRAFLHWLQQQVITHQVDAVIVAGDIFDTSAPPSYARVLYNDFVIEMADAGCQLFVLGGNHDSVAMLGESTQLLNRLGVKVVPGGADAAAQSFVINDSSGQPAALLGAVPFLRARDLISSSAGEDGKQKQQKLGEAIRDYYATIFDYAKTLSNKPLPVILTGHLTTVGASSSESVRDIYIGTLEAFNANAFPKADYIALGHIHRPQKVAKTEHIRYSGSPIHLSFDELGKPKQVLLAEFDATGLTGVIELEVPIFQPMQVINGTVKEIEKVLSQLPEPEEGSLWLSVTVDNEKNLSDLQTRIQKAIEGRPLEVLQLKRKREAVATMTAHSHETLSELTVGEVFERRLAEANFNSEEEQQQAARLRQIVQEVVAQLQEGEA